MLCGNSLTMAKDVKEVLQQYVFTRPIIDMISSGQFMREEWGGS